MKPNASLRCRRGVQRSLDPTWILLFCIADLAGFVDLFAIEADILDGGDLIPLRNLIAHGRPVCARRHIALHLREAAGRRVIRVDLTICR
jgi:hypothetical protein